MKPSRIALANLRYPSSPQQAVDSAVKAIAEAGVNGASIISFPECFIPGYRGLGMKPPSPDQDFQEHAWQKISEAARDANIAVILGTERIGENELRISTLVIGSDGELQGFQDKVQLDPSEEATYTAASDTESIRRRVFSAGDLRFGISICHEGFRYPETVRAAVRQGAQIVFHPHYSNREEGGNHPSTFADQANTFHEKAMLCRAAENTCFVATVNYCEEGSPTTSAVIGPTGELITYQPYGVEGILYADIDLSLATGLLAKRYKP